MPRVPTATLSAYPLSVDDPRQPSGGGAAYQVHGLPHDHRAWLGEVDGKWKILRTVGVLPSSWIGEYEDADAALAVLDRYYAAYTDV